MTSIRKCQASLQGLSVDEVQMCLQTEASISIKATINAKSEHCKKDIAKTDSKASFSSLFNDRYSSLGARF